MIKVYEVKETTAGSNAVTTMYGIEILIKDIIRIIESKDTINYDDFKFITTLLTKVERALQKVDTVLKINNDIF